MGLFGGRRLRVAVGAIALVGVAFGPAGPATAAPAWSISPSVSPAGPPREVLSDIACPAATTCLAVGRSENGGQLAGERWNGTAWSELTMPAPAALPVALTGVACASTTKCFAVGVAGSATLSPLLLTGNGTSWAASAAPEPAAADQAALTGVACSGASFCMATGHALSGSTASLYAARWNGTAWSTVAMPTPSGATQASISAIACTSPTNCFAVGNRDGATLAQRWNGTAWSIMASPNPAGNPSTGLDAITCASATACFAVGAMDTANGSRSLAMRWNGTSWSVQSVPVASGAVYSGLNGVACVTASNCFALGYTDNNSGAKPFAVRWGGTAWQIVSTPQTLGGEFGAVACPSATACLALGTFSTPQHNALRFAERWNGSTWSLLPPPAGTSQSSFTQASCFSPTLCFAFGTATNTATTFLTEVWDASSWRTVSVAMPASASAMRFGAIKCVGARNCFAVGSFDTGSATKTLIERWNGTAWNLMTSPNPTGTSSARLVGLTCVSATDCTALGTSTASAARTFVDHWNGSAWSISSTSTSAVGSVIQAYTCAAASVCFGVGFNSAGGLVRRWNGTTWTTTPSPKPAGANGVLFMGVSCVSPTDCTAVGDADGYPSTPTSAGERALIEHWNGTAWSIATAPTPTDHPTFLEGVSCVSAGNCVAVGISDVPGAGPNLIEREVGTTWTVEAAPHRLDDILRGVSCATTTNCLAVGDSNSDTEQYTLALLYG